MKIYFCTVSGEIGQCASGFCQHCHTRFDHHTRTKICHIKLHLDRCARSIYRRIALEKYTKLACLIIKFLHYLGENSETTNPGASRTPSTFYNAGHYFESDCTMGNNLIIKTKHKTTHAISRACDQIYQGLSLFFWRESLVRGYTPAAVLS